MAHWQHKTADAGRGMPEGFVFRAVHSAFAVVLRSAIHIFIVLLLLFCPHARPTEEALLSEYQVKAALLLNFVRYSDWPASAFVDARSPYVVAVVGRDPFGKDLEKAFE